MEKINILYVITKLELGGAQKQLLSLIYHLDREKYDLFLFTGRQGQLIPQALTTPKLKIKRSRFLQGQINPFKDLLALIEIYYFIRKNKIKIVHTHSSKAGILGRLAAKLAKVAMIIHTVHGWSFNDYQLGAQRMLFVWLERLAAQFSDKIIVVSGHDQQKGLNNHIGQEHKYQLIRYGINHAEFGIKDQNIRKEVKINNDALVVGMVACFKPQKSPQSFIKLAFLVTQAFSSINPAPCRGGIKFLLVGDGILRKQIEKLIKWFDLQDKVISTGWRKDIPRLLSAMDVFVLTSLWEGLPISVLEAMAASLPVVVTNTGGISEVIIEGKTGFLVSPHDMKNMSEKVITLLKDENLRKQIGENAKNNLGSEFMLHNMIQNTQELYDYLCREKNLT